VTGASIRRLAELRNEPGWSDFVTRFVIGHGQHWEIAEQHWLEMVGLCLDLKNIGHRKGAEAIRYAEICAQHVLIVDLASRLGCPYCSRKPNVGKRR